MTARLLCAAVGLTVVVQAQGPQLPPWPASAQSRPLAESFPAPAGFSRSNVPQGSFGEWLRALPVKPGRPAVRLFDGRGKPNQSAHAAVIDIDTGARDLQQCADAVIRLRAEYLRARGRADDITFRLTNGDPATWTDWRDGRRPVVNGNRVRWVAAAPPADSYRIFRSYLDFVFTYAGSHSLERELAPVSGRPIEPGDVFIQGGFPGHAVIVLDVARRGDTTVFLLGQSYMPAQDLHVLVNPADSAMSPWYVDSRATALRTPEWTFRAGSLRRFH